MSKEHKYDLKTTKDFYLEYKKDLKKSEEPLTYKEYSQIIYDFNTFTMGKILEGHIVDMPGKIGQFFVEGHKINLRYDEKSGHLRGARVDWKTTKELWGKYPEKKEAKELVYYLNEHSDGHNYMFKWKTGGVLLTNKYFYSFIPSRHNKRVLAKIIKNNVQEYIIK